MPKVTVLFSMRWGYCVLRCHHHQLQSYLHSAHHEIPTGHQFLADHGAHAHDDHCSAALSSPCLFFFFRFRRDDDDDEDESLSLSLSLLLESLSLLDELLLLGLCFLFFRRRSSFAPFFPLRPRIASIRASYSRFGSGGSSPVKSANFCANLGFFSCCVRDGRTTYARSVSFLEHS
jgi:hypothetical protein